MKLQRDQLICYALRYNGNYNAILEAIAKKEDYQETNVNAITCIDANYPDCLWQLDQPPLCLFYKGDISLLNRRYIAMVGSRKIDKTTKKVVQTIVSELDCSYGVVSGMANGVDSLAHNSAIITQRQTIAVLGSGIEYCYPRSNYELYDTLCKNYLVISEYPGITQPQKSFFPFRNRIVAALGEKLIVPTAKLRSGSMVTVRYALEMNKDILTVPELFVEESGNNSLLKEGAETILDKKDIRSI
ncbi:MAG: DNA-processing protein DprA [Erysipelotrichaceae bacterium]